MHAEKAVGAHSLTCYAMPRKKIVKDVDATGAAEPGTEAAARMGRMSAPERGFMVDWLELPRPGEGLAMQNFRWIYGGAAKGQNMNGDAADVHASSGYIALAGFVNDKMKIKSKAQAWNAESAEKRWTAMKASYRKALNLPKPTEDDNDNLDEEMNILDTNRERVCGDFKRLFALLGEHPATAPLHTVDSMTALNATQHQSDSDSDEEENAEDAPSSFSKRSQSSQSLTSQSQATTALEVTPAAKVPKAKKQKLSKQREAEKKPFQLKKPTSEPSHKRTDIQTLFIKSQEDLAKQQQAQMRVNAMLELIKAKIPKNEIEAHMQFMFGDPLFSPTASTIYHEVEGKDTTTRIVHTHRTDVPEM